MEHIRDYFARREAEMGDLGLAPDALTPFAQLDEAHGRMFTRLGLSERSFLQVNERVIVRDGIKHRLSYSYYLITDGAEIWGYERDPSHDPAEHRHDRVHKRYPCAPVSFRQAAEEAWSTFHDAEALNVRRSRAETPEAQA